MLTSNTFGRLRESLRRLVTSVAGIVGSGGPVTIDPIVTRSGNVYTFTARRTTNLANAENRAITVAGSTSYSPAASAADFGGTFPSPVAAFAAGASTAQFQVTSAVAQPE